MKPSVLLLTLLIGTLGVAQNKPGKPIGNPAQTNNMVSGALAQDTCLNKKFSLVFYVIQDTLNSINAATLPTLVATYITPKVNALNAVFNPICVSFEHCRTVLIPNYSLNAWDDNEEVEAISNWYAVKTINIYLFRPDMILNATCPPGYTYRPDAGSVNAGKDIIVAYLLNNSPSAIGHLMGLFMGLPHTFDNRDNNPGPLASSSPSVGSRELVNRSNCYTQGDGFCDTEADPFPARWLPAASGPPLFNRALCGFDGNLQDINGDYYIPPLDNYMSHYPCGCRFTQEQYNYMVKMILRYRMYLH